MVSFELGKETEKDVFRLSLWLSGKASELWGSIPHGVSDFFLCPTLVTRRTPSLSSNTNVPYALRHSGKETISKGYPKVRIHSNNHLK